jgi:TATA-box binding protein (TBP) (component of TFIID and TFIIIB)
MMTDMMGCVLSDTGRLVGTGTGGGAAPRVALGRAQRQLAVEGGVNLHVRNFAVINQVGAASLRATLNCDAFAREHSAESHFDKQSFVGLAVNFGLKTSAPPYNPTTLCSLN